MNEHSSCSWPLCCIMDISARGVQLSKINVDLDLDLDVDIKNDYSLKML